MLTHRLELHAALMRQRSETINRRSREPKVIPIPDERQMRRRIEYLAGAGRWKQLRAELWEYQDRKRRAADRRQGGGGNV